MFTSFKGFYCIQWKSECKTHEKLTRHVLVDSVSFVRWKYTVVLYVEGLDISVAFREEGEQVGET